MFSIRIRRTGFALQHRRHNATHEYISFYCHFHIHILAATKWSQYQQIHSVIIWHRFDIYLIAATSFRKIRRMNGIDWHDLYRYAILKYRLNATDSFSIYQKYLHIAVDRFQHFLITARSFKSNRIGQHHHQSHTHILIWHLIIIFKVYIISNFYAQQQSYWILPRFRYHFEINKKYNVPVPTLSTAESAGRDSIWIFRCWCSIQVIILSQVFAE